MIRLRVYIKQEESRQVGFQSHCEEEEGARNFSNFMAVAILFHIFQVLCLLAFSALLRCLSCFNSYLHMMLMNVVGSVSVLRYI